MSVNALTLGELTPDRPRENSAFSTSDMIVASRSSKVEELILRTLGLAHLEPNWDLQGSGPVASAAVHASLPVIVYAASLGLDPHMMPLAEGSLLLDVRHDDRVIHVEWTNTGEAEFDFAIAGKLVREGPFSADAHELLFLFGPSFAAV
jgi:hypothetical protein